MPHTINYPEVRNGHKYQSVCDFPGVQRLHPHGKTQQVISLFFDFTYILVPEQYQIVQIFFFFFLFLFIIH